MSNANDRRMSFLRHVLLLKIIVTLFAWGLPALLAPPPLFALLGVPFPADPTFARLFGAIVTAAALLYWYARQDPMRNIAILRFGVLDNALVTVTILALALAGRELSWFFWLSAALTAFFSVAFMATTPSPAEE